MSKLSGLSAFRQRMEQRKAKLESGIAQVVAEKGAEIAQGYYGGKADVQAIKISETESIVEATGAGLMFREFGTGRPGQMSGYPTDKLPSETINFESAGKERSTDGWVYYYENPDTKVTVNGREGWFWGKSFVVGEPAGMEMYHTSKELRDNAAEIVRNYVNE